MKIKIKSYDVGLCVNCANLAIYLTVDSPPQENKKLDFIRVCFHGCGKSEDKTNYELISYLLHKYTAVFLDDLFGKEIELPPSNTSNNFKKPYTIH